MIVNYNQLESFTQYPDHLMPNPEFNHCSKCATEIKPEDTICEECFEKILEDENGKN